MIVAFAGNEPPKGWAVCDGSSVSKEDEKFEKLFEVIGTIHGGDGVPNFNLPDYRGRFLRGVDGEAGRDPQAAERAAPGANNTGNSGNAVGSIQNDQFKRHDHANGNGRYLSRVDGGNTVHAPTDNSAGELNIRYGDPIAAKGGVETRPKNAYVIYLIKL